MEGYYDNCIFHRIVKGFLAQTGDPTGTGSGGASIYDEPFKDEFHSRIRFNRRGLVAMACDEKEKNSNESQFFFTLGPCEWLQKKNTIFGKVTGDTVYNLLVLNDAPCDDNNRPLGSNPPRIISAEILSNPFPDITPRETKPVDIQEDEKPKKKKKKIEKNLSLVSFGLEAAEEDEELTRELMAETKKPKSAHDLIEDERLSKASALEVAEKEEARVSGLARLRDPAGTISQENGKKNHKHVPNSKVDEAVKEALKEKEEKARKKKAKAEIDALNASLVAFKERGTAAKAFKKDSLKTDVELLTPLEQKRQMYMQRTKHVKNREEATLEKLAKFREAIHQAPVLRITIIALTVPESPKSGRCCA
jgi:peptidyl-prolyl cis-trans isomerase SDCCAG10